MSINENNQDQTPGDIAKRAAAAARLAKGDVDPAEERPEVEEPEGQTVKLRQFTVTIARNEMTKVPTTVFEHELPLLYYIYSEENIHVFENKTRVVEVADFSVDAEFDRLKRKYEGSDLGRDAIARVYGDGPYKLAEELGLQSERPRGAFRVRQQTQSLEIDHSIEAETVVRKKTARILPGAALRSTNAPGAPRSSAAMQKAVTATPDRSAHESGDKSKPKPATKKAAKKTGKSSAK